MVSIQPLVGGHHHELVVASCNVPIPTYTTRTVTCPPSRACCRPRARYPYPLCSGLAHLGPPARPRRSLHEQSACCGMTAREAPDEASLTPLGPLHRVALVCDFFYPSTGGVESHVWHSHNASCGRATRPSW